MKLKTTLTIILATILLVLNAGKVQSQCKSFTKKSCLSELADYTNNGLYNGAVMFEGEEAQLVQTFYSGKDYRVFTCAHPAIADGLIFEVTDYQKNMIFSSEKAGSNFFDFRVESTQQLNITIKLPKQGTANELKKNGCVSILVGFKDI